MSAREIVVEPDIRSGEWLGTWMGSETDSGVTELSFERSDEGPMRIRLPAVRKPPLVAGEQVLVGLSRLPASSRERNDVITIHRMPRRDMVALYVTQTAAAVPTREWDSFTRGPVLVHSYPGCDGEPLANCGYRARLLDLIFSSGTPQVELGQGESAILDAGGLDYEVMNRQAFDNGVRTGGAGCMLSGLRSFDIVQIPP